MKCELQKTIGNTLKNHKENINKRKIKKIIVGVYSEGIIQWSAEYGYLGMRERM